MTTNKQKPAIKSKRDAIATHCGLELSEVEYYRYHYGLTTQPVYAFTDQYYCVTRAGEKPAKHREGIKWNWKIVPDAFVNESGYFIWQASGNSED